MVSRSRGSSSLTSGSGVAGLVALVAVALVATPGSPAAGAGKGQGAGSITGRVTVTDPPEPRMVAVTTDQAVCGTEVEDQAVVVDGSGGLANAVVLEVCVAQFGEGAAAQRRLAGLARAGDRHNRVLPEQAHKPRCYLPLDHDATLLTPRRSKVTLSICGVRENAAARPLTGG